MKKIFAAAVFCFPLAAQAVDSLSMEAGRGTRGVDEWRLGAQWTQDLPWLGGKRWVFYWDGTVGNWGSDTGSLQEFAITPTLRYGRERGLYADGGIGFHVVSEKRISSAITFSTKFQFGDHLGIGYRFERYDLSLRLQHLSNAGIRNPNPGVNFLELRLQYWLDRS